MRRRLSREEQRKLKKKNKEFKMVRKYKDIGEWSRCFRGANNKQYFGNYLTTVTIFWKHSKLIREVLPDKDVSSFLPTLTNQH